jgi:hypothetical protein
MVSTPKHKIFIMTQITFMKFGSNKMATKFYHSQLHHTKLLFTIAVM